MGLGRGVLGNNKVVAGCTGRKEHWNEMKLFDWMRAPGRKQSASSEPIAAAAVLLRPEQSSIIITPVEQTAYVSELRNELFLRREEIDSLKSELAKAKDDVDRAEPCPTYVNYDLPKAIEILRDLGNRGNASAQIYLAIGNLLGAGIPRNAFVGEQWLSKAAAAGEANAQILLGILKLHGVFLERGVQQALHWLSLASESGSYELESLISEIQPIAKATREERRKLLEAELRRPEKEPEEPVVEGQNLNREDIKERIFARLRDDVEVLRTENRTRGPSSFPEDEYKGMERNSYILGRKWGRLCIKRAVRFNRLMAALIPEFKCRDTKALARRFAMHRGYLQHSITDGMEDLKVADCEITPEMRDIFIRGVRKAIEQGKE
jgi:hypothetical protein